MNDNWIEIVETLQPYVKCNSSELEYQHEIEGCLKILGWKTSNKTMQSQLTLGFGAGNTLRPDIILYKNGVPVLPIEIKRPDNVCNDRQVGQLGNYMRQLKSNIGLYFGENIRFYYDNPDDLDIPVNVLTVELSKEDSNGESFCEMLSYEKFNTNKLEEFCKERYCQIMSRNNLCQRFSEYFAENNATKNIVSLIKEKFINEGYEESIIDNEIKYLQLSVSYTPKGNITPVIRPVNNDTIIINTPTTGTSRIIENRRERKQYTRTASKSELIVKFDDGTIIHNSSAIEVERQFIIKVGIERVRSLGITQCHEDLIGKPNTCRNPEKYINRWTPLMNGLYLFNCSNNGDKKKHIERIISSFRIKAKVEIIR